uniref:Uncharacterized protein n=1 Tax=Rhizophora mucronata TaxID=61149 RepID=A0A2P2QPA2_RHIMU
MSLQSSWMLYYLSMLLNYLCSIFGI